MERRKIDDSSDDDDDSSNEEGDEDNEVGDEQARPQPSIFFCRR